MNDEERKSVENARRVATNLGVLLDIGLFPGKHSFGVEECKNFVNGIVQDATRQLESLVRPPEPAPLAPVTPPAA